MGKTTKGFLIAATAVMLASCTGGGLSEKDRNAYEHQIEIHSQQKDLNGESLLFVLKQNLVIAKAGGSPSKTFSDQLKAKYAYHEEMERCLGEYMDIEEPLAQAKTDCTLRAGGEPLS